MIDAHIHLDLYEPDERDQLLTSLKFHGVKGLVAVSMNLDSCRKLLNLKKHSNHPIFAAFGFHPEQALPDKEEVDELFRWIRENQGEMTAIGEVGLPYYSRTAAETSGERFDIEPYVLLLEQFVKLAAELGKPIVLHAVYEDAEIVCDLLEKHGVKLAHFHWFKGSVETLRRMKGKGYTISITPDIVYKERTKSLVEFYPLNLLMVETDGPWPFQGPFEGRRTHPSMIQDSIREISVIKKISVEEAGRILFENTIRFYNMLL